MRGASRESFASVMEAFAGVAHTEQLAAELRFVSRLFTTEPSVRRAVADPSRSTEARSDLVEQLFNSHVGSDALSIVARAAQQRWSTPLDLATASEQLAVTAELALAQDLGVLDEVEDEIFRFGRIVAGNPSLAAALGDATVEPSRRARLMGNLLRGKVNPITARLIEFAAGGLGGRPFDATLDWLVDQAAAQQDRQVAYVTTASPLSSEQEERLARRLATMYGHAVSVRVAVDPSLLGGVTIRIGDDLYDGSVAHRLAEARAAVQT